MKLRTAGGAMALVGFLTALGFAIFVLAAFIPGSGVVVAP